MLIPVRPQMFDLETLSAVRDVLQLARNPAALVVVSAAPVQGRRHADTIEVAKSMGFSVCPVVLYHRAAHGDATNIGQGATEYAPDSKAAEEVIALYTYIRKQLAKEKAA